MPPGFARHTTTSYDVVISETHGEWLRALAAVFDIVWATTWGESANLVFGQLLNLPRLPVLPLHDLPRDGTRKLAAVAHYVEARAVAWVDDELYDDAETWARSREFPTLLIRTRASAGLQRAHVNRLRDFARQHAAEGNA